MKHILVLDFGGQYAHLIAKRFRALGFYSEIVLPSIKENMITDDTMGIVFSGSPSSVYDKDRPEFNTKILESGKPILGLCYGHQIISGELGGKVEKSKISEFGFSMLEKQSDSKILKNIEFPTQVWMSHADEVTSTATGFKTICSTKDCVNAGLENTERKIYSFQFHAEVKDTPCGNIIFQNFAEICKMQKNWDTSKVLDLILNEIREKSINKKVLLFLSGGVDSTVAFALLNKALGQERVLGLHIDNGFMRKNESKIIEKRYKEAGFDNFIVEDAETRFLDSVKGMTDPQEKRKNIGNTFITVRDDVVKKLNLNEEEWLLAQGTLYPDIIESGGSHHAHVIKTHHNRVEGIEKLIAKGLIIEPLKDLYKDEVRVIGKELGLSNELIYRHPFPGPGLSINVLCSDTNELKDIELFNKTIKELNDITLDQIYHSSLKTGLLPVKSVGVQGDFRTYTFPAKIQFSDNSGSIPNWDILEKISSHITNSLRSINRVVLTLFENDNLKLQKGYCTKDRLDMLREVDSLIIDILKKNNLYTKIFQHLTILLPYASDENKCSIVLRPVISEDVMTARFAKFDNEIIYEITDKVLKLDFVDALFYDVTNKPPATFGWE